MSHSIKYLFTGDNKSGIMSPGSDAGGAVFSSSWDDSNIASHMEKARRGSMIGTNTTNNTRHVQIFRLLKKSED